MKKALIVGGSNGIGLAVSAKLISMGYNAVILDKTAPDQTVLTDPSAYTYIECNLLEENGELFEKLSGDPEIDMLMITAGFGRVAPFEALHPVEIHNLMQVNASAVITILRYFYDRLRSRERFYCGVMGSIAGLMSSPLMSVYAASKSAVCRLIESINIEMEVSGTANRILNVSPASVQGTRFNGGDNALYMLDGLAEEIIRRMTDAEELYIPKYEETFRAVLERYHNDPHEYGLHSYEYKMQSGRISYEPQLRIGYLSGTFDLFHIGHLNLLRRAKENCDYLIVGIHPNGSHKNKETFISLDERKAIVSACRYVDKVVDSCPEDSDAWKLYHYNRLFVGSDYKGTERFARYEEYFRDKDVEIIYFPYTKGISSSHLRKSLASGN